jgi:hypothetical protein
MRFRKKPVEVEARRLVPENADDLAQWCGGRVWRRRGVTITTMEGSMLARWGDWIIQGVAGEFYPCAPAIFEATYEEAF